MPRVPLSVLVLGAVSFSAVLVAQEWRAIPLVTPEARAAGFSGGEGCQWPVALEIDPVDGSRLLLGTDVGGVFRSMDGGRTWAPSNRGLLGRGACDFAFDPADPSRILLVACNSSAFPWHGLFLSEDAGVTWKPVQPYANLGYRDFRDQVAFVPSSASGGRTRTVFWSSETVAGGQAGLYRSDDAGNTWRLLPDSEPLADGIVRVVPADGTILVGNSRGLWVSRDGGRAFERVFRERVSGLDVSRAMAGFAAVLVGNQVRVTRDAAVTWTPVEAAEPLPAAGFSGAWRLHVSPADPEVMAADNDEGQWAWSRRVTRDGGRTWRAAVIDPAHFMFRNNNRQSVVAWHPTDAMKAFSFGGDAISATSDGGARWTYSNDGYTGVMTGGSFNFNAGSPSVLYLPSQDYDGAITADGGTTWRRVNTSGEDWGGYSYGGYALSDRTVATGQAAAWGGRRVLRVTRDGGVTRTDTGLVLNGAEVSCGDPRDGKVAFVYDHRTADGGVTWARMEGCEGVFIAEAGGDRLFGRRGASVVVSRDHGQTWSVVTTVALDRTESLRDVAHEPGKDRVWFVTDATDGRDRRWRMFVAPADGGSAVEVTSRFPASWRGERGAVSVAVDAKDPRVMYAARPGNYYLSDVAALRSTDGGETWHSLNARPGPDGGREASWVRVHPVTREAWFGTSCFGLWKIPAP
jgi:hypothetical protein